MKKTLLILACAFVLAAAAWGQKPAGVGGDRFDLGGRAVVVPAPESFTNGLGRFDRFTTVMTATESPDLDILLAHVPTSMVDELTKGPANIDFYTKVSVAKKARTYDLTLAGFDQMVASVEKNFGNYIDLNNPRIKRTVESANTNLKDKLGPDTHINMSQPTSLGFFDKKPGVFSGMILMNVEGNGVRKKVLNSMSYVLVNRRLIYVYAFKTFTSDEDVKPLEDFAKKWTAAIRAANKVAATHP